jgi:hypothetical protein
MTAKSGTAISPDSPTAPTKPIEADKGQDG